MAAMAGGGQHSASRAAADRALEEMEVGSSRQEAQELSGDPSCGAHFWTVRLKLDGAKF